MNVRDTLAARVAIENAMRRSQRIAEQAAGQHLRAFKRQMREKFGIEGIALDEPYLPFVLARGELNYLRRLDRLEKRLAAAKALEITIYPPGGQEGDDEEIEDEVDDEENDDEADDEEIDPELAEDIDRETDRSTLALSRELDAKRQREFGITHYIWVGGDCPLCAPNDGQIFEWGEGDEPGSVHPNCDCYAEPLLDEAGEGDAIEPVYPIETLTGLLAGGGLARQLGKEILKRVMGEVATPPKPQEPVVAKPITERPKNIPENWRQVPSNKGDGIKYVDPKNPHNDIRMQRGNPNSSNPFQRKDYVRWKRNGQWLDKNGKPSTDYGKTHIPLDEFEFDSEIFQ